MSRKRQRSASPDADIEHDYWISEKIEDRDSIFQGYFSPTMPAKQLQDLPEIKSASHRILGWRSPGAQRTLVANVRTLETGTDDDGERYGGRTVLKVLEQMRVEGAIVVARWYGGQMLGPARFGHMENCARDAVSAWRQREDSEGQKRRRVEDEAMERASLVVELDDRDHNIKVLRDLLQQKTTRTSEAEQKTPSSRSVVAAKIDYDSMSLDRLRQLDKARDSTVAFLLKRIDEAEKRSDPRADSKEKQDQHETAEAAVETPKPSHPDTNEQSPKQHSVPHRSTAADVSGNVTHAISNTSESMREEASNDLPEPTTDTKISTG